MQREHLADLEPPIPSNLDSAPTDVSDLIHASRLAILEDRSDHERWIRLGMVYQANHRKDLALICYQQAVDLDPTVARSWYYVAILQYLSGEYDMAIEAMRTVNELNPDLALGHWKIGYWLLDRNEIDNAESHFARATQIAPRDPVGWVGLAMARMSQQRDAEAAVILEQLLEWTTLNRPYIHQLLGSVYIRLGRVEEAEHLMFASEGIFVPWPEPWTGEVRQYLRSDQWKGIVPGMMVDQGRHGEAITLLQNILSEDPDNAVLLSDIGNVYRSVGEYGKSIQALKRSIELDAFNFLAHHNLAAVYLLLIDEAPEPESARRLELLVRLHAELSLELNPSHRLAHGLLGRLSEMEGDVVTAIAEYTIVARDPDYGQAWINRLCTLLLQEERWEEAADVLKEITYRYPPEPYHVYQLAVAQLRIGRMKAGMATINRYVTLWPDDDQITKLRQYAQQLSQENSVTPQ
ncbi:MAG: tetratricopeptide repeat protein [Planctomycetota bacterium]|nr:tetratricopeptide repeat protein [Planctomycetota bacterium]